MARCRTCGSFGILAIIHPLGALQPISFGTAAHELPHPSSPSPGNCQGMKPGLRLSQINEVLRNTFLLECALDHLAIAAAAHDSVFEVFPPAAGEVVDVSCYLVGHHQR